jgi:hypothetical protein
MLKQAVQFDDLFGLLGLTDDEEEKQERVTSNLWEEDAFEKPKNSVWEQNALDLDAKEHEYRLDFNSITKETQNVSNEREARDMQISVEVYGFMDLDILLGLEGKMGEKREWTTDRDGQKWFGNYTEEQWNEIVTHVKENGMYWGITVDVLQDGVAKVYEGNHRIQIAKQLGWSEVPVHVRYYGHSQKTFRFN